MTAITSKRTAYKLKSNVLEHAIECAVRTGKSASLPVRTVSKDDDLQEATHVVLIMDIDQANKLTGISHTQYVISTGDMENAS